MPNNERKLMTEELIDIYDENMNPIGTAPRSQVHKEGLWHKAFHCWIARNNKVIFQQRSFQKIESPGLLGVSAAGHLSAGEAPKDGIREIEEELGIKVDFDKLTKLYTGTHAGNKNNYINNEFNPTYLLESEIDLAELKLQPEEVDGIYEAEVENILKLFRGEVNFIKLSGYKRTAENSLEKSEIKVKREDFEPKGSEFYIKAMETIKRYFNGQKTFEN